MATVLGNVVMGMEKCVKMCENVLETRFLYTTGIGIGQKNGIGTPLIYIVTMNESSLIISNTYIIPHNSIALTIAFIKKKTKLSCIDLKKMINNRKCVDYT